MWTKVGRRYRVLGRSLLGVRIWMVQTVVMPMATEKITSSCAHKGWSCDFLTSRIYRQKDAVVRAQATSKNNNHSRCDKQLVANFCPKLAVIPWHHRSELTWPDRALWHCALAVSSLFHCDNGQSSISLALFSGPEEGLQTSILMPAVTFVGQEKKVGKNTQFCEIGDQRILSREKKATVTASKLTQCKK